MSELDNSSPMTGSVTQVIGDDLPDLKIYGYLVQEKLSEHRDRQRITYLATDIESDRLVVVKEWRTIPQEQGYFDTSTELHLDRSAQYKYTDDRHILSGDYANYLPEIERLQQLDHLNIPRYLNSFPTPTGFCVVREYQSGVSLAELGDLPPSDIKMVADAVLKILKYLHQLTPAIIHQNIKPENIIVDTETKLMMYLVDFGLHSQNDDRVNIGNPGFTHPDLSSLNLTSNSDLYSFGISLICLITGTSTSQAQHLFDINHRLHFRHLLPPDTDPQLIAWLETMVESNYPQQRFDAATDPHSSTNLDSESTQTNLLFKLPELTKKIQWLPWGITVGILFGLGWVLHQFLFPDSDELSPAQIAKNQSIANQAEFAASDRGRLIKEKRCTSCNLNNQNFVKAELTGAIVSQSSFNGTNFSGANLTLAIFRDADLSGANLSGANLQQAAFYGAKLIDTNLVGANLSNAKLVYANLKGSGLHNANLSNTDLKFAEFQQVDLTNANLTGANLSNADLTNANLRHAILTGAKLDGTNLTGATMPDGSIHP
jgi:uncharacterized protein YjbI with pentapeptide repeats